MKSEVSICFFSIVVNPPSLKAKQSCSNVIQIDPSKSFITDKIPSISSSLSSNQNHESKTIRSFSLFLCTFLLITNWLRLSIYLFPKIYPHLIKSSSNLCILQSFSLHVLTLFHFHLTITTRLFWHYCFICNKYWQTITYCRLFTFFLFLFLCLCFLTWPSISNDWASITFDPILNLCIVNYIFHLSYTFFIVSFTCLIPFILLIISHYTQMKCIKRRMWKYFSTFTIEQHQEKSIIIHRKNQFKYASYGILIWSFINMILLIAIHIPIENETWIKSLIFYMQMLALLIDPILYIFIFRSLEIITLLRPINELDY